ncbi:MAG: alpha/beta fold hydrolase [Anaerolineae bacterium]
MRRILLWAGAGILILLLIGPFLVPAPPLKDTVPPEELADPDSQFIELHGIRVHYKEQGAGGPAFLLLHGFGASTFSWREVMGPLASMGRVIAFDRPAFGLTERPMPGEWGGFNPYTPDAQVALTLALMDALNVERAILVGNSAGGTVAVHFALTHPERVQALVLVDPAVYTGGGAPAWLLPLLRTPQARHLGPLLVRRIRQSGMELLNLAWHDPGRLTPEILAGYTKPLRAQNWDRALWELTIASRPLHLERRLHGLTMPVLVITGDDDRVVPTEQSIRLAGELPNAELAVIPDCGHVPQEECPTAFLEAVKAFIRKRGT